MTRPPGIIHLAANRAAALRTLDEAREIAARPEDDCAAPWAGWLSAGYVDIQGARCLTTLGAHDQATGLFRQAIADLPPSLRRDRGVYLARQAIAHAGAGDPDSAASAGLRALAIAQLTRSGRIITELRRLDIILRAMKQPDVAGFRDALATVIPRQARDRRGPIH